LLASVAVASAQPSTEHVTVTGTRSRPVIDGFVQAFAAPTRLTGKIARWEDGICITALGLKPAFLKFVTQRVRAVAVQVGAPVNADLGCEPNLEIVFTTTPQGLADGLKKDHEIYLGYADNAAQRAALAKVTHPIQAWYATETKDLRGMAEIDNPKGGGIELQISMPLLTADGSMSANTPSVVTMNMPHAHARNASGSRLGDGLHSAFHHVIIAANPDKLVEHEIGALADYISLLALAQLDSLDICQHLPSIVNLLAPGCERPASALTDNDLAYLRGLYHMGVDRTVRVQKDQIAYQMQQALEGKK
jgi:hypothetical protein